MKPVLIEWVDSQDITGEYLGINDSFEQPERLVQTVGWLAHDGKNRKIMVPHRNIDIPMTKGFTIIPTKSIRLFLTLQAPEGSGI